MITQGGHGTLNEVCIMRSVSRNKDMGFFFSNASFSEVSYHNKKRL
jgi:hypothetical protein